MSHSFKFEQDKIVQQRETEARARLAAGREAAKRRLEVEEQERAKIGTGDIEVKGKKQTLNIALTGGQTKTINLNAEVKLLNTGATINLLDKQQQIIATATYKKQQVKKGVSIQF